MVSEDAIGVNAGDLGRSAWNILVKKPNKQKK
jgi:hypothetical protein